MQISTLFFFLLLRLRSIRSEQPNIKSIEIFDQTTQKTTEKAKRNFDGMKKKILLYVILTRLVQYSVMSSFLLYE